MTSNLEMTWDKLLSSKRYGTNKPEPEDDIRSPYERDIDRIIFSSHFRRLGRKTQVHPLNENDHIHSRLSHSLETASVGRSLGLYIGAYLHRRGLLPSEHTVEHIGQIVQAACLAHDIGNPPFGHSGENAIKAWFTKKSKELNGLLKNQYLDDFLKFDGNAMSLRILTKTGFDGGTSGMRPTYAVLGALLKYPTTSDLTDKDKFSCFQSEKNVLNELAESLGLITTPHSGFARHPLAFLTEAADDICYRIIDLEDATEVGIVDSQFILRAFSDCLELTKQQEEQLQCDNFRQRNGKLRAWLVHKAIIASVKAFIDNYKEIMRGELDKSLLEVSDSKVCNSLLSIYKMASEEIFFSKRKVELEIGAQRSLAILLDTFGMAAFDFCTGNDTPEFRGKIESILGKDRLSDLNKEQLICFYEILIMILDYIAGMTDQYATQLCRKFIGIGG